MTTNSPARQIKSALTKAFPGTKFSVTTSKMFVTVYWTIEMGSKATRDAVKAVAKPLETAVTKGDWIDDSQYTIGHTIVLRPETSPERNEWAIKTLEKKYNAKFNGLDFVKADGSYVDSEEFRYYLWNADTAKVEPDVEIKEAEVPPPQQSVTPAEKPAKLQTSIIPTSVQALEKEVFIEVRYPSENKCNLLEEYTSQVESYCRKTLITEIVELSHQDYWLFTNSFLTNQEWLKGKGGTGSEYESPLGDYGTLLRESRQELEKWRAASYKIGLVVTDGKEFVIIDPQGYDYARYVGFSDTRLNELLESISQDVSVEQQPAYAIITQPTEIPSNFHLIEGTSSGEEQNEISELLAARRDRWEEKKERKLETYERLKDKHEHLSADAYRQSKQISRLIPFGQPIMVGHHSEGRHRRDVAKIHSKMGESIRHQETAEHYAHKLEILNSNTGPISSDDPDAIAKLEAKLADMQHCQEEMKTANKIIRSKKLSNEQKQQQLIQMGYSSEKVHELIHGDIYGRIGFRGFELSNNSQNIARVKERIAELKAKLIKAVEEPEQRTDYSKLGFEVVRNRELDRLQLIFDGKPPEQTRTILKTQGFRWSPSNMAWQRQLNGHAESALYRVVLNLQKQQ